MNINEEIKDGLYFKGYNVNKAVKYALQYALEINPKFGNYEKWGGDCTNYVSQCLYAGEIPFDWEGIDVRYHWYWHSETKRTPSWTAANSLKFYMEENGTNKRQNLDLGLRAIGTNQDQLLRGDIVQLIDHKDNAYHSMIVTDYVVQGGQVMDYLVSQHSGYDEEDEGRLKNYPLSHKRGIKVFWSIMGYVTQSI
ncbi:MAG TPA: amidase domain-containing protein [Epulopiscium sp.]|nr:amidase domain-containing protein [Candidatus Epulonipiscium sp.]